MPRKGTSLERMVAGLQGALAGDGVEVQSNRLFRDHKGNVIAEIDVVLSGRIGSSEIAVGIECRDRPSDGPQGAPWITEVHGKKQTTGMQKMIAVSTTGFNDGAVNLARTHGIDLISVREIDETFAENLVRSITFQLAEHTFEIILGSMHITTIPSSLSVPAVGVQEMTIWDERANGFVTIVAYLRAREAEIYSQLGDKSDESLSKTVLHRICGPIDIMIAGIRYSAGLIQAPLKIVRNVISVTMVLNAHRVDFDDVVLGLSGWSKYVGPTRSFFIMAVAKIDPGSTDPGSFSLRVSFLDETFKPYQPPGLNALTLYGLS